MYIYIYTSMYIYIYIHTHGILRHDMNKSLLTCEFAVPSMPRTACFLLYANPLPGVWAKLHESCTLPGTRCHIMSSIESEIS